MRKKEKKKKRRAEKKQKKQNKTSRNIANKRGKGEKEKAKYAGSQLARIERESHAMFPPEDKGRPVAGGAA